MTTPRIDLPTTRKNKQYNNNNFWLVACISPFQSLCITFTLTQFTRRLAHISHMKCAMHPDIARISNVAVLVDVFVYQRIKRNEKEPFSCFSQIQFHACNTQTKVSFRIKPLAYERSERAHAFMPLRLNSGMEIATSATESANDTSNQQRIAIGEHTRTQKQKKL